MASLETEKVTDLRTYSLASVLGDVINGDTKVVHETLWKIIDYKHSYVILQSVLRQARPLSLPKRV